MAAIRSRLDTRTSASAALKYLNQNFTGFFLGTGHEYHVTQMFVVRLDFTSYFYQAPEAGNTGGDTWFSDLNFGLGLGVRL